MILALAGSVLGDPIQQQNKPGEQQPAAQNPSAQKPVQSSPAQKTTQAPSAKQPTALDPPVGKELSSRELQALLYPIMKSKSAGNPDAGKKKGALAGVVDKAKGIVNRALSFAGVRYRWGGTSRSGVDCSGLTRLLYLKEGVNLPHNAKAQFKVGQPVAKAGLLPGDLVFFNTRGPLTHVGMFIGNNKFIHAANRRSGVKVDSLSAPYYANRYAGARRYKNLG